jgi:hypothetical protein
VPNLMTRQFVTGNNKISYAALNFGSNARVVLSTMVGMSAQVGLLDSLTVLES